MEKIKLLITMTHMGTGGAEKALISLLHAINYDLYDVDLSLMYGRGYNLKYIPKEVRLTDSILDGVDNFRPFRQLIKQQLKKGGFLTILRKIYYSFCATIVGRKNYAVRTYFNWKFISKYIPRNEKKYDIAIGYLDGFPHYYVMDKVEAKKKICWVHNDYSKVDTYGKNFAYLNRADLVATVSQGCVSELQKRYPKLRNVELVHNLNSPDLIEKMAMEPIDDWGKNNHLVKLVSVGRLCEQKAYHLAIKAAKILKNKKVPFEWVIIGDGNLKETLQKMIQELEVEDVISLIGLRENPYPYMRMADIVVQTSIYEGKSIAIDEAKILNKPIVCTNYNSAKDQIIDGETGLLVDINSDAIASGVECLINSCELRRILTNNLSKMDFDQTEALKQNLSILVI